MANNSFVVSALLLENRNISLIRQFNYAQQKLISTQQEVCHDKFWNLYLKCFFFQLMKFQEL